MTLEILLARRLLEAAVDPEAPRALAEEAGAELAEIASRNAEGAYGSLPLGNLEGLKSDDLSPLVWLLLLDGRRAGDAEVPPEILETLFLDSHDPAIRFRLVSGALAQPGATASYEGSLGADFAPERIEGLPVTWPWKRLDRIRQLAESPIGADTAAASQLLAEFMLYLLQDGSDAALALAAGAIAPADSWRQPAHELVRNAVRSADPDLSGYGRVFRRARI
ncbi:hypothetical protein NDN16_17660 [Aureimonas altamirensis]|uniref:hypothetical protein n=1 Tax=Aureimonas altamirensis TaxID=370622 RepID=UPI00203717D4|nr:hypothetical protein [Aureimonas altamirensis]MCM2505497.1 hypothetical protein [Aureimonas altamirensis]